MIDAQTKQQIYATDAFVKSEDEVVYSLRNSVVLQYLFPLIMVPTLEPPTTTTQAATPDPRGLCSNLCLSEAEDSVLALHDLESCCIDGGK